VTLTIPAPAGKIPTKWLSYPGPPRANVLLPTGYDPHKRYPLLVLLNGLANNYASYAEDGIVTKLELSGLDAIVVMPEGGSGWYADWWNDGQGASPAWESYELDDVLRTILARYPILPQRRYHTIAGFSMGGLGAVYLAGRLPGFFGSVASLSGFVDPQYFAPITVPAMGLVSLAPLVGDHNLNPVYGPPYGFYADGHNPTLLTMNLKQTRVFESTGTGAPSSAGLANLTSGGAAAILVGSVLEAPIIYPMNQLYHAALTADHVDVTYQVHSGGHDIPDFYNEFNALLTWGLFKPVVINPASWVNDTVATSGQLWDIGYRFAQPPKHLVQFRRSGNSLSISAAGSAVTITTGGGCSTHTPTPATVHISNRGCK
jgi:S-formylglutathione hydrolase FrmB